MLCSTGEMDSPGRAALKMDSISTEGGTMACGTQGGGESAGTQAGLGARGRAAQLPRPLPPPRTRGSASLPLLLGSCPSMMRGRAAGGAPTVCIRGDTRGRGRGGGDSTTGAAAAGGASKGAGRGVLGRRGGRGGAQQNGGGRKLQGGQKARAQEIRTGRMQIVPSPPAVCISGRQLAQVTAGPGCAGVCPPPAAGGQAGGWVVWWGSAERVCGWRGGGWRPTAHARSQGWGAWRARQREGGGWLLRHDVGCLLTRGALQVGGDARTPRHSSSRAATAHSYALMPGPLRGQARFAPAST